MTCSTPGCTHEATEGRYCLPCFDRELKEAFARLKDPRRIKVMTMMEGKRILVSKELFERIGQVN